jgi:hypothetical protein
MLEILLEESLQLLDKRLEIIAITVRLLLRRVLMRRRRERARATRTFQQSRLRQQLAVNELTIMMTKTAMPIATTNELERVMIRPRCGATIATMQLVVVATIGQHNVEQRRVHRHHLVIRHQPLLCQHRHRRLRHDATTNEIDDQLDPTEAVRAALTATIDHACEIDEMHHDLLKRLECFHHNKRCFRVSFASASVFAGELACVDGSLDTNASHSQMVSFEKYIVDYVFMGCL